LKDPLDLKAVPSSLHLLIDDVAYQKKNHSQKKDQSQTLAFFSLFLET